MTGPLRVYGSALRRAASGQRSTLELVRSDGVPPSRLHPALWTGGLRPGDRGLIDRCAGATLDVGCGPGRLAAALTGGGWPVLGVDVSAEAVRQARRRGAAALRRDVFEPLPHEGRWQHVLLADGNIGIGGDPVRLLRRCSQLLAPRGGILVELGPPGTISWATEVVLRDGAIHSRAFDWAEVATRDISNIAYLAALRVVTLWTEAQRWFALLAAS